jgi:DNA-binding NarL/FixJ family response regulator
MTALKYPTKIGVLVVDDDELTRLTLQYILKSEDGLELVALAANGQEAIEQAKIHHPDVVILDLQMPVLNGLSAATTLKQISPRSQILAYSSVEDPQMEVMIQTAPIDEFCPKGTPPKELLQIIRRLGKKASKVLN